MENTLVFIDEGFLSNHLLKSCSKWFKLTKEDFK